MDDDFLTRHYEVRIYIATRNRVEFDLRRLLVKQLFCINSSENSTLFYDNVLTRQNAKRDDRAKWFRNSEYAFYNIIIITIT